MGQGEGDGAGGQAEARGGCEQMAESLSRVQGAGQTTHELGSKPPTCKFLPHQTSLPTYSHIQRQSY